MTIKYQYSEAVGVVARSSSLGSGAVHPPGKCISAMLQRLAPKEGYGGAFECAKTQQWSQTVHHAAISRWQCRNGKCASMAVRSSFTGTQLVADKEVGRDEPPIKLRTGHAQSAANTNAHFKSQQNSKHRTRQQTTKPPIAPITLLNSTPLTVCLGSTNKLRLWKPLKQLNPLRMT